MRNPRALTQFLRQHSRSSGGRRFTYAIPAITAFTAGCLSVESAQCEDGTVQTQMNSTEWTERWENHVKHWCGFTEEDEDDESRDQMDNVCLIAGSGNPTLADDISRILETPLVKTDLGIFADGEIKVKVDENLRGMNVFIVQPTSPITPGRNIHDNLMELFLLASCAKRANARKVTAVIPYYGYARHDRIKKGRETIAAADIAKMLQVAGVDEVISVDLHRTQIEGFFENSVPVSNIEPLVMGIPFILQQDLFNPVVVCPSSSGVERAKKYRNMLQQEGCFANLAFLAPKDASGHVQTEDEAFSQLSQHTVHSEDNLILVGDVKNKDVVIVDNMIDTATRVTTVANFLRKQGAKRIFAFVSHGLFSEESIMSIENSAIDDVLVTNTNPVPHSFHQSRKIHYMSIAPMIAEVIRRVLVRNSLESITHPLSHYKN